VYNKCHKKISKLKRDASRKQTDDDSDRDEIEQPAKLTTLQSTNESLQSTGEAPIKIWLGKDGYPVRKMKRTENAMKQRFLTTLLKILMKCSFCIT
jgi:hypothetical protein